VIAEGLHEFLDGVQRDLILLAGEIGTAFFRDWRPLADDQQPAAAAVPTEGAASQAAVQGASGQAQTQSVIKPSVARRHEP